jgi:hypothetical protein
MNAMFADEEGGESKKKSKKEKKEKENAEKVVLKYLITLFCNTVLLMESPS